MVLVLRRVELIEATCTCMYSQLVPGIKKAGILTACTVSWGFPGRCTAVRTVS